MLFVFISWIIGHKSNKFKSTSRHNKLKKEKVTLSQEQVVEAYRVVRC
jgi:hypothetical protein